MGSPATPMPMETIDSPSATMMIRPYRSAKCLAEFNRQSSPATIVHSMSPTMAASHRAICTTPWVMAAMTSRVVPMVIEPSPHRATCPRNCASSALASQNTHRCTSRATR
ncbi:Uncharacterised protein [Mycobacteroides abscessus subsp. abscessus]|nr:Uncharacterised protein [Mycobacteroides abscessus subsp. abscessus]